MKILPAGPSTASNPRAPNRQTQDQGVVVMDTEASFFAWRLWEPKNDGDNSWLLMVIKCDVLI